MKSLVFYFMLFSFLLSTEELLAQRQLKIGNISAIAGQSFNNESLFEYNYVGISGGIEYPIKDISFRFGYSLLLDEAALREEISNPDRMVNLNLLVGNVFRKNNPLQIPVFVGFQNVKSRGNFNYETYGITGRVEMRYYFHPRFAISTSATATYAMVGNVNFEDPIDGERTADLRTFSPQIGVGVVYCYIC